jgi:hypothetical protein
MMIAMKRYYLLAVCFIVAFSGCDSIEPVTDPGTHPFFPYKIGDEYVIEEWGIFSGIEFTDTITYRVVDVVKLNGNPYYRVIGNGGLMYFPGEDPLPRTPDTSLFRVDGSKVFSRSNRGEYAYIDFDAPYAFSPEPASTMGFVKDTLAVQVPAGQFDGKLMRMPQPIGAYFIYAKDVGFVTQFFPEYRATLLSAKVGGRSYP